MNDETLEIEEKNVDETVGKKKNTKGWGIVRILVCTAVTYALLVAFGILGLIADGLFDLGRADLVMDIFGELGMASAALIACSVLRGVTGERVRDAVTLKNFSFPLVIALTLAGFSLGEVFDHVFGSILSCFMTITPDEAYLDGFIAFISAVICAPLFEELIFRFSFIGLLKKNSGMAFTVVFTSLIFALVHTYNIQNTGNVFLGTVLVAYVYWRTGNILYTMAEHALHNALCFLPLGEWKIFGEYVYYEKNGFILSGTPWFVINVILLVISMAWIVRYFMIKEKKDELSV